MTRAWRGGGASSRHAVAVRPSAPPGRGRGLAAVLAVVAAATLAGCVAVPSGGRVQRVELSGSGSRTGGQPVSAPVPPRPGWLPVQVVQGFLVASASFAGNHAVAREYLAPGAEWHPENNTATVVGRLHFQQAGRVPSYYSGGMKMATVTLTGQRQATLNGPQPTRITVVFQLVQIGGVWLIKSFNPPNLLLLTEPYFKQDYQSREVYFYAASTEVPSGTASTLVPDPVYVLGESSVAQQAKQMVISLAAGPPPWLSGASTAFPAGTTVTKVRITDTDTVVVNLGGAALHASRRALEQMAAQLAWSLTGPAAPGGLVAVRLEIGGKVPYPELAALTASSRLRASVPPVPGGTAYYLGPGGLGVRELRASHSTSGTPLSLPALMQGSPLTAIAVSPAPQQRLAACDGARLYETVLGGGSRARLSVRKLPGTCTSLSYDISGDLWVATEAKAGNGITAFLPDGRPAKVTVATGLPGQVTALRLAPDGVRMAMIVKGKRGSRIMLASVSRVNGTWYVAQNGAGTVGANISTPVALSWLDPYDLAVLGDFGGSAQLFEVPLSGGASTELTLPVNDITSIGVSGSGLIAGSASGELWSAAAPDEPWHVIQGGGQAPVYRG